MQKKKKKKKKKKKTEEKSTFDLKNIYNPYCILRLHQTSR